MKSLVTGGVGFIGSHVVNSLLERGDEVIVLDDLSGGCSLNLPPEETPKFRFVGASVVDNLVVDCLFEKENFDYVYHLAAYAAEGLSHFIRRFNYENNLIGSINLINASVKNKVKCFVFTSSVAVYGAGQVPFNEETVPKPEDPYGISKYAVELDLKAAHEMFGLNYIIFRPHNVYGERQNIGDPYRNVVGIFMNQIMQGKPCTIFGDGRQMRAFSHISDVAPIIAKSVLVEKALNQTFNIGADDPCSVWHLYRTIAKVMGKDTGVVHLPPRNEVVNAFCSHIKLCDVFGYKVGLPVEAGLELMAGWAKKVGIQKGQEFKNIEIDENLPESWRKRVSA